VTLDEAKALLAEPPRRRSRGGSARGPLKELGADPSSGKPIVLRDGRFGPYVTDGETNASLRQGDTPDTITLERAVELLAKGALRASKAFRRGFDVRRPVMI
jgi:DNA topoisomerase-1